MKTGTKMSNAIERIKGYCCQVTQAQWEELVRVADEVGCVVDNESRRKGTEDGTFCFVQYNDGELLISVRDNNETLIPYPDFLAKLKGDEKWEPKNGEEVEVSGNNQDWYRRIFVVSHANMYYCADATDQTSLFAWKHCRQFRPTITRADAEQQLGKRIID